ncbi:unnamed protein product [Arctogadus glacialis]
MISDYMGVKPELFPHTCSLCTKPCFGMKGWLEHRNHIVHLARSRLLRRQYSEWEPDTVSLEYSEWDSDTVSLDSTPEESQQPPTTTAVPASSPSSPHHPTPFAPSNSAPPLPRRILEALALASWTPPKRSRSKVKVFRKERMEVSTEEEVKVSTEKEVNVASKFAVPRLEANQRES